MQVVFAVQGRQNFIMPQWKDELCKYVTGIVNNQKQKLYIINCMQDHIHILLSLSPTIATSDLVRDIKSNSSAFINNKKWLNNKFNWQEGFGAFTYGQSQLPVIINYIKNQEDHHKRKTFREEYIDFLKKFEVDYNEKYLFEFYD